MKDKYLPIKFFEKRVVDEQLTEPGGSNKPPKWVLQGNDLTQHASGLSADMNKVTEEYYSYQREDHTLPMIMTTTILDKAIAKSHRGEVVDLLNSDKQANVIGLETVRLAETESLSMNAEEKKHYEEDLVETRRILSVVASAELISNIRKALQDTNNSAKLISSITKIAPFRAEVGSYNPNNIKYRVRLIDYQDSNRNALAQQLFKNKCHDNGITIERETRYSKDMMLYRVSLDSLAELEKVGSFEGVYSIEEAVPLRADLDSLDDQETLTVKMPEEGKKYPVVGVLDSGIAKNKYLQPWILDDSEEYYEPYLQDKNHGSMVASVLEYSDEMNGTDFDADDGVKMFESIVIPDIRKAAVYPEDVIDNVRDTIERHKEIKIWTMSVGTDEECALDEFSEYGMALDNIADENDVLIIKSAGNTKAFMHSSNERIAKMADSVRSLVVGSIANGKGKYDFVDIDRPSPFTRIGPGPAHIIKPDLVAYGGNAGKLPNGKMTTTGVNVLDEHGFPSEAAGTSFSTPWVARIASELEFSLDGDFDPLLIKALMIHNAGYPAGEHMSMEDKKRFMGFGMPQGTRDILYNSENEITLILRDKLQKGTFIDILDFPFAESLIGEDGYYHGQIILTLVSAPILRTAEGPEYCQSNINVSFGTMDGIKSRDTTKRNVRNPYGADNAENLLKDALFKSNVFNILEDNEFGQERTLLKLGSKYHPIKKYAIDLDELKPAIREKTLGRDRKWYMKVEALFRDAVERETRSTGVSPETDFCILLTVKDPSGNAPVYNEVTQQLEAKNFIYSNIQLKNEVRVRLHPHGNGDYKEK